MNTTQKRRVKSEGHTEGRTRVTGFRVPCATTTPYDRRCFTQHDLSAIYNENEELSRSSQQYVSQTKRNLLACAISVSRKTIQSRKCSRVPEISWLFTKLSRNAYVALIEERPLHSLIFAHDCLCVRKFGLVVHVEGWSDERWKLRAPFEQAQLHELPVLFLVALLKPDLVVKEPPCQRL